MKKEDAEMMEKIFDTETIGYAYLYPADKGTRQEGVIAATPENLANYIGSHLHDAEKMIVTDMCDRLILDTYGGYINSCPDQNLCREINKYLSPVQMGEFDERLFDLAVKEIRISKEHDITFCLHNGLELTEKEGGSRDAVAHAGRI